MYLAPNVWPWLGVLSACLFFSSVLLIILCILDRRLVLLPPSAALAAVCYFILQCISTHAYGPTPGTAAAAVSGWFAGLPAWTVVAVFALIAAASAVLFRMIISYERSRITPMSVKAATDSLPSGICFYMPGGRVVMVNRAMEEFCIMAAGGPLINGEKFRRRLFTGELAPGCETSMIGISPVITAGDGRAWSVTEKESEYHGGRLHMLLVADVTEVYGKTLSLKKMRERLAELNGRLTDYNREIVALTAQKELLSSRFRLHDEMGADLLVMRRYISGGGTEQQRADIEARLRRNVTFLKTGQASVVRDEYELMLETAEKLGVHVIVTGALPQTEPHKHIIATAIHECFTNTLRHAHGTELYLSVYDDGGAITAIFTNNGKPPEGEIRNGGGLSSLRILAENAGGRMEISTKPVFSITLELPKEVPYAL